MGFFDFLTQIPPYSENAAAITRLNKRHKLIVEPFRGDLQGARVLDLAAHDGRWAYALAEAGAREVVATEARQELIDRFDMFPEAPFKSSVKLHQGDVFSDLAHLVASGELFDIVAVFGIFYHIMDHFRLLDLIRRTGASKVLIDGDFAVRKAPVIELVFEKTCRDMNAAPQIEGQAQAVIGIPSRSALENMARALDFDVTWSEAERVFGDDRRGVRDYFRADGKQRAFCTLVRSG